MTSTPRPARAHAPPPPAPSVSSSVRVALVRDERAAPLAPAAVVARGALAVDALVRALLGLDDDDIVRLRGVIAADKSVAVVIGLEDALPWFDGARYLGEAAPGLFIPTTRSLSVPAAVAAAALHKRLPAAVVDHSTLVPLRQALPLTRAAIERRAQGGAQGGAHGGVHGDKGGGA